VVNELPVGVTTLTSTRPLFVGTVALMKVEETTEKLEDGLAPKNTSLVAPNPRPVIVTFAPPPADTVEGEMELTTGGLGGEAPAFAAGPPAAAVAARIASAETTTIRKSPTCRAIASSYLHRVFSTSCRPIMTERCGHVTARRCSSRKVHARFAWAAGLLCPLRW
jgi:hypothetical protein